MDEKIARSIELMDKNEDVTGRIYFYIKRCLDILISAVFIILLFIPMLIIALAVVIDSRGPVFFMQERVGFRASKFKVIKFRTMYEGAHKLEKELMKRTGNGFVQTENDERVTSVGNFLRKLSLDELPQIFNIFIGNMSLVGPRPLIELEVKNFTKEQMRRHDVMPGLTGLAQINGRSKLTIEQKVGYDLEYVKNFSLWQDIVIILKSIPVVLCRKNAV
ncbi:MAG: sugar transferase [Christensenellales bacterium]|jgi:lipopolysaccharide/colanic/teichoic acid biosynthesis glycosyltransferase